MNDPRLFGDSIDDLEVAVSFLQQLRARWADCGHPTCSTARGDLTSIVMVTHNQRHFTEMTLLSLRLYTSEPCEIIVVDNASTDGTPEYLRAQPDVHLIENPINRGFPAACNQGIRNTRGKYILLLNNDVIVTSGWLARMLEALNAKPEIGLVGPLSNNVSGPQKSNAEYNSIEELDVLAARLASDFSRQACLVDRLVGFCLLFPAELRHRVGLLDERFREGMFEDDDFCRRARLVGYELIIACDVFIHHYGSMSFKALGMPNTKAIFERNLELFCQKWGLEQPRPPEPISPEPIRPPAGTVTISLCMIVRDNERTIAACLESIRPWVDEMIVVDTGSVDRTPDIAAQLGAKVFHFPWCDDFSAARNESLRHAKGEWILWMDSDDTIDASNGRQLRELVSTSIASDVLGIVMQVHCPGPPGESRSELTVVDHVKVLRSRSDLRFEGRIHEQVLPAIRRAGGRELWTQLFVVHSGYDHSDTGQQHKRERDLRLLHLELEERPEHPFTLFNLGMTYTHIGQHREAVDYLRRCIRASTPSESHLAKAYALLVHALRELDRLDSAWEVCRSGLCTFPDDCELRFREALLLHSRGLLDESIKAYRNLLLNGASWKERFKSLDPAIHGFKARQNLAVALADAGRFAEAEQEWQLVVQECPSYRFGWRGLADSQLRQGTPDQARVTGERLIATGLLLEEGFTILGQVALQARDVASARMHFQKARELGDPTHDALRHLCRLEFENGTFELARQVMEELTRLYPEDASAWQNLGTLYLQNHCPVDACACYEHSVRLRPDHAQTLLYYAMALRDGGNMNAAANMLRRAAACGGDPEFTRQSRDLLHQLQSVWVE
jgi:GT2 family glycosyltransferase/tetratricopeptide (TPR) repeat protein